MSNKITILIIDDDHDAVDTLYRIVSDNNIKVIGKGYNGLEAVELYKKLKPDVIVLDILMPKYDGHYAIDNIKEFDPDAKILVITADVSELTGLKLRDKKIQFLYKPYEHDDIISQIESFGKN